MSQTPAQFALVKTLFEAVCDLPLQARMARLNALSNDQAVIAEVLSLTNQTSIRTTRFAVPVMNMMGAIASDELKAGDTIGAWTLEKAIGHGGMGAVYLAKRSDGHFAQTAAIKLIFGIPSGAALEYLARERQILANLSHPNIARLFDGGATPSGQPYLVMEYIDGVPIDEYCTSKKLGRKEILALFLEVAAAVGFAHQQLVVHCDLKPSNILVDHQGRPVLLDFGIARLIDSANVANVANVVEAHADADLSVLTASLSSLSPHTPYYASPEQRDGGLVSTKTDIYTLGILIGDALDGALDGALGGASSAKHDADIAAILAKASAESAANRYASVDAFAKDIERYLTHEPVEARPATSLYQVQKLIERRWPWVLVASLFVVIIAGATLRVVSERDRAQVAEQTAIRERKVAEGERDRTAQAEQATAKQRDRATEAEVAALAERDRAKVSEAQAVREKNRATQAEASAQQTSEFLVSVFDSSNPNADSGDIPASKLLAAAEARLEREMHGQPATQAALYSTLARVQSNMGSPTQSRQNIRRAIAIERKLNRPLELARMLTLEFRNDVSKLDNANLVALANEALALREKFAPADSEEIAEALAFAAYAQRATSGDLKGAERLIARSIAIREKRDPTSLGMAETMHIAGQVYGVLGQRETAIECYRRAIAIKQDKLGAGHPEVLLSLQYLAGELNRMRQFAEAEVIFRRIVLQNEKLHGRQNVNMLRPLIYLGTLLTTTGRSSEALQLGQEALQIAEKTVGRDSTYAALAMGNIGSALIALGDDQAAAKQFREALGLMKKYMRPIDNAVAEQEIKLGRALSRMGRIDEAKPHLQAAYEIYRRVFGDAHRETVLVVVELIRAAITAGNRDDQTRWQAKLPSQAWVLDREVEAEIAMLNALRMAKTGSEQTINEAFLNAERLVRALYGDSDARTWLAMLPRCEWLAERRNGSQIGGTMQSRALAGEILRTVWLNCSATYTVPAASTATPLG